MAAGPTTPSTDARAIALVSEDLDWPFRVNVNGLPMGWINHKSYPEGFKGESYVLIPAFLLTKGKNTLTLTWKANEEIDLQYYKGNTIRFVELDSVEPQKIGKLLGTFTRTPDDVKAKKALQDELAFEVTGDFPAWKWTTSTVITDGKETEKKLIAAASDMALAWGGQLYSEDAPKTTKSKAPALDKTLADQDASAKRSGVKKDGHAALFRTLVEKKKVRKHPVGFEFRDDSSRMQLLAGGKIARLAFVYGGVDDPDDWNDIHVYPWAFIGGRHDAEPGPINVSFDIWFRLEGGNFVPTAIWREGPAVDP